MANAEEMKNGMVLVNCPGCKMLHQLNINPAMGRPLWNWNKDTKNPTFTPSLVVSPSKPEFKCHSFIRHGQWEFLTDSFHELKGKVVDMVDVDHEWN